VVNTTKQTTTKKKGKERENGPRGERGGGQSKGEGIGKVFKIACCGKIEKEENGRRGKKKCEGTELVLIKDKRC